MTVVDWSLIVFHLWELSLKGNDCFQTMPEHHECHVFHLHHLSGQLNICGCSDLTLPTSQDTVFPLLTFLSLLKSSLLTWIMNVTVLLLRATICIYCGKGACCFLIVAHSCWNPEFKLWIETLLPWHYRESPEDGRNAFWGSHCAIYFYFPQLFLFAMYHHSVPVLEKMCEANNTIKVNMK